MATTTTGGSALTSDLYLGIDFGTSGCRATLIDANASPVCATRIQNAAPTVTGQRVEQSAQDWLDALESLLGQLSAVADLSRIKRLAIDGTSGSVVLCSPQGKPLTPALMYNDASSISELQRLKTLCPDPEHLCLSLNSGLVRAMQLARHVDSDFGILNQADFIAGQLLGQYTNSDYHNALKLGYDPSGRCWPDWMQALFPASSLPQVHEPGQIIGRINNTAARRYGFSPEALICAGTTDANAAFIASGVNQPGQAVTSLGSTLVLKMLSETALQDARAGVYSHRIGDYWLAGGASNAGAAILRDFFSDEQLVDLSRRIDPQRSTGLNYYPLRQSGERFPVYDPDKQPVLGPKPDSDEEFLHAIFEGLAAIEHQGYQALKHLGAPPLISVTTAGGGANNEQWQRIREKTLGKPVSRATHSEASYGSALLALRGLSAFSRQKKTASKEAVTTHT